MLSREDELRLLREYRLGRIVDQVYHNLTTAHQRFVTAEEVAEILQTTPEIVEHCQKLGKAALRTLTRCNNRLIFSIIKNMQLRGLSLDAMLEVGQQGLYEAIERHDPECGNRLATYARHYIRSAVWTGLAEQMGVTDYAFRLLSKYRMMWFKLSGKLGRNPTVYNMAEALHWTIHQTEKVAKLSEEHRPKAELNMHAKMFPWDRHSKDLVMDHTETKYMGGFHKTHLDEARRTEHETLRRYLNDTEYRVIKLKYGPQKSFVYTNDLIALECQMTVEEVERTLAVAKEKLKVFPEAISIFDRVVTRAPVDPQRGDGAFDWNLGITEDMANREKFKNKAVDDQMVRDQAIASSRPDIWGMGIDEPDYELPQTQNEFEIVVGGNES